MSLYPEEFVRRVESEYEGWPEIIALARDSKYVLGKFLAEGASQQMSPEEIVLAFNSGRTDAVLEDARSAIRRRELHRDWLRMMIKKVEEASKEESPSSRRGRKAKRGPREGRPDMDAEAVVNEVLGLVQKV